MEQRLPGEGVQPAAVPGQAPTTPLPVSRDVGLDATGRLPVERAGAAAVEVVGTRWVPVHGTREGAAAPLRVWTAGAVALAAVLTLLTVLLAVFASDTDDLSAPVSVLAVGGALVGGVLLLGVGIGLVLGEAVRAADEPAPARDARHLLEAGVGSSAARPAGTGLTGLTAGRALVFAGALLLAVGALAGALGLDDESTDPDPAPTRATASR